MNRSHKIDIYQAINRCWSNTSIRQGSKIQLRYNSKDHKGKSSEGKHCKYLSAFPSPKDKWVKLSKWDNKIINQMI